MRVTCVHFASICVNFFCFYVSRIYFNIFLETPHQYSNQPSAFYPVAPQELSIYYPLPTREPNRTVYEPPRPQTFHLEPKMSDHYTLRTPASHGHVIHPGSIPITQQAQPKGKCDFFLLVRNCSFEISRYVFLRNYNL